MGGVEDLILLIEKKTNLSREEIIKKIKLKQKEFSGLVSDEGAACIVANELGIKTRNRVVEEIKIEDIVPELKAVNILGRVKQVNCREFKTKDGRVGKIATIDLVDLTGSIRVVLWNMSDIEKVEKKEIKRGDIIKIKSGYVKKGLNDKLEVHVGNKGKVITEIENVDEMQFPSVDPINLTLDSLKEGEIVNVIGKITHNFGLREFKKNERIGKVGTLILNDGTSSVRIVLWDENAKKVNEFKIGETVEIYNGIVKKGLRGFEIHLNNSSEIKKSNALIDISIEKERKKINELKEGDLNKEVKATVVEILNFDTYEMCPICNKKIENSICEKCGEVSPKKLIVLNLIIDDGTKAIRATLFDNVAKNLINEYTNLESLLGEELLFSGKVKINEFTENLELIVKEVKKINPIEETKMILNGG